MSQFLKSSISILGLIMLVNSVMIATALAAKDFNIKNDTQSFLFVNGTSGNIGLGTTTPQGGFTITNGKVGIGTWAPVGRFQVNGIANTPFVVSEAGNVGVGTSILGGGFIVMNGNVGIGTWAPTAALT